MIFDFMFFLTVVVILTGVIALFDKLFWEKKRKTEGKKQPLIIEYSRSFFPVLLLVLVVRAFLIQPYRVPTGSLAPTILPGDFIVVNQYAYGLRLPIGDYKVVNIGEPKIGDIALFRWPKHPSITFIKRVIGTPGDHIVYKNKKLYINGELAPQEVLGNALDDEEGMVFPVVEKSEVLVNGNEKIKHDIYVRQDQQSGISGDFDIVVPANSYFMMGDNRDGSDDSRDWGFVPGKNLIGRAIGIWMSWDSQGSKVRWHRIGNGIK